jgi:hypothetical protein
LPQGKIFLASRRLGESATGAPNEGGVRLLPVSRAEPLLACANRAPSQATRLLSIPDPLRGQRILVVDDVKAGHMLLVDVLRSRGCCSYIAMDGRDAVQKAQSAQPDLRVTVFDFLREQRIKEVRGMLSETSLEVQTAPREAADAGIHDRPARSRSRHGKTQLAACSGWESEPGLHGAVSMAARIAIQLQCTRDHAQGATVGQPRRPCRTDKALQLSPVDAFAVASAWPRKSSQLRDHRPCRLPA